jgi:hypothetical protein
VWSLPETCRARSSECNYDVSSYANEHNFSESYGRRDNNLWGGSRKYDRQYFMFVTYGWLKWRNRDFSFSDIRVKGPETMWVVAQQRTGNNDSIFHTFCFSLIIC